MRTRTRMKAPVRAGGKTAVMRAVRPESQAEEAQAAPPPISAQLASAARFGHSLSKIQVGGSTAAASAPVQRRAAPPSAQPLAHDQQTEQAADGLPPALQAGIEQLSGLPLGDVRVHYGSPLPAGLNALAYAQGGDIHLAPGQEQHLPHEAWHVVQQRQGRVQPTLQAHGAQINDDPALEHEADAMGQQASLGLAAPAAPLVQPAAPAAPAGLSQAAPVQRKIELMETPELFIEDISSYIDQYIGTIELDQVFQSELASKPNEVRKMVAADDLKLDVATARQWIDAWDAAPGSYTYDTTTGMLEIVKDAIRFYLYKTYSWRSIGAAEYMTGDATGLAMAALVDPMLTVQILTGPQVRNKKDGPSFLDKSKKLPGYFEGVEKSGQIVLSDTKEDSTYKGTSDRYAKQYNAHIGKQIRPWDRETYEATDVIGKAYANPQKRELIKSQMQLSDSLEDQDKKQKIEEYKRTIVDPLLAQQPCLVIWGRMSGQKGGAHPELDTHAQMLHQLSDFLRQQFPERVLVFVGDEAVSQPELAQNDIRNQTAYLGEFWREDHSGEYATYLKDRNAQRYFFQLLATENQAISLGMRSGSLEGLALLGLPVIFIDDRGNNAAGRMEFWAGGAADKRAKQIADPELAGKLDSWEQEHAGPVNNYKRIATYQMMGDQIGKRAAILESGAALLDRLLKGSDHANVRLSNEKGEEGQGYTLTGSIIDKYRDTIMAGKLPEDSALIKEFMGDYEKMLKQIENSSYMGQKEEIRSPFKFNINDIETVEAKINRIEQMDDQVLRFSAITNLWGIKAATNVVKDKLTQEWETSDVAKKLLGTLLTNPEITKEDVQAFNARFSKQESGFKGKLVKAAAGKVKFKSEDLRVLQDATLFMLKHNVLQQNELQQASFLVKHLAKNNPKA